MTVMKKIKTLTKAYRILLVFLLTGSFFALGSSAVSAALPEMPGFTSLDSIVTKGVVSSGVATDAQGRVYVADSLEGRVIVYTQSGRIINTFSTVPEPISVAVAPNGTVYVGSYQDKSVTAYTSTGSFKLGKGPGEFISPRDIEVDSSGKIYVADLKNNSVRVYGPDGASVGSVGVTGAPGTVIGTTGILQLGATQADGETWHPLAIAINEGASELIVLDRQQVWDPDYQGRVWTDRFGGRFINGPKGAWADGARIQVFGLDGNFKRSYKIFGYGHESGEVSKPSDVAVDTAGRLYLSDTGVNKLMVYSEDTATIPATLQFLGKIDNSVQPLRQPTKLTISKSNILYVVSRFAQERVFGVQVFGLDNFSASIVAPSPIIYQAILGGNNPVSQTITIENLGNTDLTWTVNTSTSWLSLAETTGTLVANTISDPIEVPALVDGLAVGSYEGTVSVVTADGVTDQVKVTLDILPNPLVVDTTSISLTSAVGTAPTAQKIHVTSIGKAPLNWTATADQTWINLSPASGTVPTDVTLTVNVTDLAKDTHKAVITLVRVGDDPGPVTVAVELTLTDDTNEPPVIAPELPAPGSAGLTAGGKTWRISQIPDVSSNLRGVWGTGSRNIMVVGDKGIIRRFDGKKWQEMDTGKADALYSVWGSAKDNVYVVGDAGTILRFDGKAWTTVNPVTELLEDVFGTTDTTVVAVGNSGAVVDAHTPGASVDSKITLRSIWGTAADKFYAVGGQGVIIQYDGANFEKNIETGTKEMLNSVWGRSDTDVFAVGEKGTILHKNEKGWTVMTSGTTETLNGVWGNAGKDVFAVGVNGTVLHYNGTEWNTLFSGGKNNVQLNDVWVSPRSFAVAVGDNGTILTAGKARFPWSTVIRNIIHAAQKKEREKEKETVKKK